MATYVPNASTLTEPTASRTVASAAEEFRVLKTSLDTRADLLDADLTVAEAAIDALEVDVAALELQMAGVAAGTDSTALAANLASTATGKGTALLGVEDAAGDWSGITQEAVNAEIGFLLIRSGAPVNALRAFTTAEQAAIIAKTSTTDHQTQLADLLGNNKAVHFPFGRYNGSAAITVTDKLHIGGHRHAELRFTDGAYVAIRFTGSSAALSLVENLWIVGTNNSTPAITLLKFDSQAAYNVVRHCTLAYAAKLIEMDGVYVTKLLCNSFSNADVCWSLDDVTFGTADIYSAGNTYGTSLIGTQALVQCGAPGLRIVGDCWETQNHAKPALDLMTGSVFADVDARFEASGEVLVRTSVEAWLRLRAKDSYSSSTNRFLRVDASGSAYVSHSQFLLPALDGTKTGISASGACYVSSSDVKNWGVGALFASTGQFVGGSIRGCTTGIQLNSGSTTVVGNDILYSGNTTNIVNNSNGSATAPGNFTATLTGCTTSPTSFCRYEVNNGVATVTIPAVTGTSNSNAATLTGFPTCIQPASIIPGTVLLTMDNGVRSAEKCTISGGTLTLYKAGNATGFTSSGSKGVSDDCTITYRLRNV